MTRPHLTPGNGNILILLFLVLSIFSRLAESQINQKANNPDRLYQGFADPPHEFTVRPFWFWNGNPAGVRVWLPYQFDVTKLLHPGRNRIQIIVANSMENARAIENHAGQLENLKLDGLLGRVQLIPYFVGTITLRPATAAGEKGAQK